MVCAFYLINVAFYNYCYMLLNNAQTYLCNKRTFGATFFLKTTQLTNTTFITRLKILKERFARWKQQTSSLEHVSTKTVRVYLLNYQTSCKCKHADIKELDRTDLFDQALLLLFDQIFDGKLYDGLLSSSRNFCGVFTTLAICWR